MASHMAASATKLTYEDLVLFPDDGKRHELIDGEHVVTPSPNTRHQACLRNLTGFLLPVGSSPMGSPKLTRIGSIGSRPTTRWFST